MPRQVILDTGFWYALYEQGDNHHDEALLIAGYLEGYNLVVPWPCLYETLNTRFVRRREWLEKFGNQMRRGNVERLPDQRYRERALLSSLDPTGKGAALSLVDHFISEMLADESLQFDAMVTFNVRDFADVCERRGIEIFGG